VLWAKNSTGIKEDEQELLMKYISNLVDIESIVGMTFEFIGGTYDVQRCPVDGYRGYDSRGDNAKMMKLDSDLS